MTTVAITTTVDRFDEVAALFSEVGFEPVAVPCVRIDVRDLTVRVAARTSVRSGVVLVLSSARTVELLWPDGGVPQVRVFAVGAATERAIRDRGGRADYVGCAGLAALAEGAELDGCRVVFPHAAGTAPRILERIAERAASLDAPVVYETVPVPPPVTEVDAVAFGSPSAVRGWTMYRGLTGMLVGAVGPTTARELEDRGRPADVVAKTPDLGSLADSMATTLEVAV